MIYTDDMTYHASPQVVYDDDGDYIVYGAFDWPSHNLWMIPGTWMEDQR